MAINAQDLTFTQYSSVEKSSMRYHELALVNWLNKVFIVQEGYPVPCVLSSPLDAFAHFRQLWADENNPFKYLLELRDADGTPLYEPFPSPMRYPVISVHRKNWKLRQYQNFSIHRFRHINWPTVSDTGDPVNGKPNVGTGLTKFDLANVTTSRMPTAVDYRFQVDYFCMRPDTQAIFIDQLLDEFWRSGGPVLQTWIKVNYPGWDTKLVRLYVDGDIENLTPEEPEQDRNVEFRTSFSLVLEGFDVDLRYKIFPAFWTLVIGSGGSVDPSTLDNAFEVIASKDARIDNENATLDYRDNVPTEANQNWVLKEIGVPDELEIDPDPVICDNQFGEMSVTG